MADARATVLGCPIDRLDTGAVVARVQQALQAGEPLTLASVTKAKLVAMQRDAELRQVVEGSDVVLAEDRGVVAASRITRGRGVPGHVDSAELMLGLLALAAKEGHRVYILGGALDVLERAIFVARDHYPGLDVAGHHHGYFYGHEEVDVAQQIRAVAPDLLFVAMPSPRKEYWLNEHLQELGVSFVMGVGGSFDVVAGKVRRAPGWVQRAGGEWLYRLCQEPRRMWKRYLVGNTKFVALTVREWRVAR